MVLSIILRRYELDPMGNTKEKASILCPQIEDVFGLKLHTFEDNKKLQGKVNRHIFVALILDSLLYLPSGTNTNSTTITKKISVKPLIVLVQF